MAIVNKSLARELILMAKVDQEMRMNWVYEGSNWNDKIDKTNQRRLKLIVNNNGWPTISLVGKKASSAAWLVVQHAPDLKFQEKCLALMEQLTPGEIKPANIAFLKDRTLMRNGKPQIYGTQFVGFDTDIKVYNLQDPEHVDERRASVGLGTFSENEARLHKVNRVKN